MYPGRRKKTDPPKPPMLVGPSEKQIEFILAAAKDGLYKTLTQTTYKPAQRTQQTKKPAHNDIAELEQWLNEADQEDITEQLTHAEEFDNQYDDYNYDNEETFTPIGLDGEEPPHQATPTAQKPKPNFKKYCCKRHTFKDCATCHIDHIDGELPQDCWPDPDQQPVDVQRMHRQQLGVEFGLT